MNRRIAGLIGLSRRAGKLAVGSTAVRSALAAGRASLVVLDADASPNAAKEFSDACRFRGVALALAEPGFIGEATGRDGRIVAALTDEKLAAAIRELIDTDQVNAGVH